MGTPSPLTKELKSDQVKSRRRLMAKESLDSIESCLTADNQQAQYSAGALDGPSI